MSLFTMPYDPDYMELAEYISTALEILAGIEGTVGWEEQNDEILGGFFVTNSHKNRSPLWTIYLRTTPAS